MFIVLDNLMADFCIILSTLALAHRYEIMVQGEVAAGSNLGSPNDF